MGERVEGGKKGKEIKERGEGDRRGGERRCVNKCNSKDQTLNKR